MWRLKYEVLYFLLAVFQRRVGGCILLFMGCGLLRLVYKVSTKVVCVEVSL